MIVGKYKKLCLKIARPSVSRNSLAHDSSTNIFSCPTISKTSIRATRTPDSYVQRLNRNFSSPAKYIYRNVRYIVHLSFFFLYPEKAPSHFPADHICLSQDK